MRFLVKRAEFLTSAFHPKDIPAPQYPEAVFAGRSNAGKSSLINAVLERRRLVKVGSRPGFTQSINFFSIEFNAQNVEDAILEKRSLLVDLPGYGYAKAPKGVIRRWKTLIETYFSQKRDIRAVVTIFDVRRGLDDLDLELLLFLRDNSLNVMPVFNKCDKFSSNQLSKRKKAIKEEIKSIYVPINPETALTHEAVDDAGFNSPMFFLSAKTRKNINIFKNALFSLLL